MSGITVTQQSLVLKSFAAIFQNNLVASDLYQWNKFAGEMNDRNKLTVIEQVGPRYAVSQTTDGVKDLSGGTDDSVFGSEQYTINKTFNVNMGWGDIQRIRDIGDARESEALKNAAIRLAETIDAYLLGFAALASDDWTGTPGTTVADYDDIASGYTRLKDYGVEDTDLRAVLTYGDKQALGSAIVADNASLNMIGEGTYREGFTGSVAGIPTLFTQQLPTITTGTRTNGAINGATQNVNYSAVAASSAPGNYLSQTISLDGVGSTGTVVDGEVFTIAGVYAWDNRLGASLGRLQQFRVIGGYTASTGAIAAMRITPAIIVPASGSGGDVNTNTANATVDSAPADNAVITWVGSASTAYKPRFIANKAALVVNTVDLIMPATGIARRQGLTKVPLSVRMWQNSTFATGQHDVRFDVALTAAVVDRRRLVRINGS
jgi:hypothetical protein